MKKKICKCGHNRDEHERFWRLNYHDCTKCRCSLFLRRERPDTSDKIFNVIITTCLAAFWVIVISTYYFLYNLVEDILNEPFKMSLGNFAEMALVVMVVVALMVTGVLFPFDYFIHKRRRIHPEDKE